MTAPSKSAPTAYVPGEDPETIAANQAYQDALRKLTESLDQRKNRLFDPMWLAAAKGFLDPGAPNFFESLGRVSGNLSAAQAAKEKEEQDIAQQRLGVATQGLELQRQKAKQDMARRILMGEPAAGPRGGLPSGSQPAGGALAGPSAPPAFGLQIAPAMRGVTREQYLSMGIAEGKDISELLKSWEEMQRKRREMRDVGVFDTESGYLFPFETKPAEQQIRGYPGTYPVSRANALALERLWDAGDIKGYQALAKKIVEGPVAAPPTTPDAGQQVAPGIKPPEGTVADITQSGARVNERPLAAQNAPVAPAAAAKPPTRLLSKEELEREAAKQRALAEAETKGEIATMQSFQERASEAGDSITMANMFRRFSELPNADKMVGILNKPSVAAAIAKLVQEGIGGNNFRVSIPAIEDVMRNAGLTPEQQAQYRIFLYNTANMRLQLSKYMKGSVSNFEQQLMGSAAVSPDDNTTAIRIKADLLRKRAQFDRQVYRAFKDSKMTAEDFKESELYEGMKQKYDDDMADIAVNAKMYPSREAAKAAFQNNLPPGLGYDEKGRVITVPKR